MPKHPFCFFLRPPDSAPFFDYLVTLFRPQSALHAAGRGSAWRWPARSSQEKRPISPPTCRWLLMWRISALLVQVTDTGVCKYPPQCRLATFFTSNSHTHTHRDSCTNTWLQEVSHLRSGYRSGSLHVQVIKTTVFGDINTCKTHHMCESD